MRCCSMVIASVLLVTASVGCGSKGATSSGEPPKGTMAEQATLPPEKRIGMGSPSLAKSLEQLPPKERAAKIREYKEKGFNKTFLKSQLEKFLKDPDPEVVQATKEAIE